MQRVRVILCVAALWSPGIMPLGAQMTLGDALLAADRSAYGNRIAAGTADVQRGQALAPLRGILPSVRVEAGYIRTTDPIGVFGATLRQRTVSPANFDPQRLNFPGAVGNYQSAVVLEQPIFNADAWMGRRAAVHAFGASRAQEEWTRLSTRVDVVRAYYGAVLATERARTLESAARAAHAHLTQADAMVRQGLVTKSDALLASVRAGEVDGQLAEAVGNADIARRQLAVLLGGDGGELPAQFAAPTLLPSSERIRAVVSGDTAGALAQPRADLRAADEGLVAARAEVQRARSAYLPRVNSFVRYDWNSPDRVYASEKNWTAGVMASWSPFAGAGELADIRATTGRAAVAQAQSEAAQASARLDVEQTRTMLSVALTRLALAERAASQSTEAHRIVGRKYEGGLATIVELLDAQAVETQSTLALSHARWGAIVAGAERLRALGRDPAAMQSLDDATLARTTNNAHR